ncbi:glycosyltransferase [Actinomycetospora termitidis]|uniref:Glycosyltransferase n=1 Tax=Actinomycetospora termitidis TaxID=3053470 RepID=A0ABT7MA07_9PSEU|nr:glycosyltransferase [Actinomycetospora sp. Odt1-22]MDL5157301.1 glycosyltransferase [Actinomycetospora sp. Odt1-22]
MARRATPARSGPSVGTWILLAVLAVLVVTVLGVTGLVNASIGNDSEHEQGDSAAVPASVSGGGTFVDGRVAPARSTALPPRTIALTFDDGPDPTWTPQILAVLAKHRVPGTFFVVGSLGVRHPDLLRQIRAAGGEIGIHTFTHADLSQVPRWRLERELGETQLAIAGATGETTYLVRPPFSSTPDAIDDRAYDAVLESGQDGYVNVFTDVDGEDWQRPGVDAIVRNATPRDGVGATVLLHDAGGDRSQTVAALDRLIPELQARGYRFETVTGAVGAPAAHAPASDRDRLVGGGLVGAVDVATGAVRVLQGLLLAVGGIVVLRLLLTLLVARRHARRRRDPAFSWGPEPAAPPPVSVIVPAYNETENIEATLRSILANEHPLEILVVDDGSTDGTAELVESLALPAVRVIRQPNSGKPIALNTGVARAKHDLVVMMDGDTVFQADTVARLVAPFADPRIGAVAGNVKVANRAALIPRLQHIEYVVGFGVDRRVQDTMQAITTIPGAAGAFRREAVLEVGGLSLDTLAEDTDLTIALGRAGWRVVYEERAVAWTEAPTTVSQLWRQRYRWTYGTMQAVWKHRRSLRERGASGRTGWLGLGHIGIFQVLFPLAAPLVDVFFVYGLVFGDAALTLVLWGSMLAVQTAGAAYAFRLDGEPMGPLWVAPVQQILYRPLMYAVLIRSVLAAVTGGRVRWQRIQRLGALRALMPGQAAPVPVAPSPGVSSAAMLTSNGRKATPSKPATPAVGKEPLERTRWLDVLRAIALVRVIGYHVVGWGWLSFVFPSMGVMFALGGSLMLASLARAEAVDVIGRRLKRLLPPFWLFGLIVVPVMLWHGFGPDEAPPVTEWLFWFVPVLDPPGSEWAGDATVVLWYIRTYLWLVLLTPALLWAWRRRPALAITVPLVVVALDALLGGAVRDFGAFGTALVDASIFAGCWMLGFAHRDGSLRRMPWGWALLAAGVAIGAGVAWALANPAGDVGIDLNDIPLGQALVSLGAVLLVLRYTPRLAWLERIPLLGRVITVINARAVTIYLWHNVAIALAPLVDERLGWSSTGAMVGTAVVLTVVLALGLGWIEDVAAGRRPALIPGPAQRPLRPRGPKRPVPAPPEIPAGGMIVPAETEESSLAALNALRPASDFRQDPRFRAPAGTGPGRRPLVGVPDARRAGPFSQPGPALRPSPPGPSGSWPAARVPSAPQPAPPRRRDSDPEAITGVVGRAPSGRRRLMSFGDDPSPSMADAPPGRRRRAEEPAPAAPGRSGSHRAETSDGRLNDLNAPSRHRR